MQQRRLEPIHRRGGLGSWQAAGILGTTLVFVACATQPAEPAAAPLGAELAPSPSSRVAVTLATVSRPDDEPDRIADQASPREIRDAYYLASGWTPANEAR